MEIKQLALGELQTNCYLISTEKAAVVIDPADYSKEVESFLADDEKETMVLLTHAHFDHIGGAKMLRENTGAKIAIGAVENPALSDGRVNLSSLFGEVLSPFSADILLNDGDEFTVGDICFTVLHTPGHTKGSLCYRVGDILFAGDTLFCESIGRTDFPGGDFNEISASIKKLYTLPEDTVVLSGHGDKTTIGHEKYFNPFVRGNI